MWLAACFVGATSTAKFTGLTFVILGTLDTVAALAHHSLGAIVTSSLTTMYEWQLPLVEPACVLRQTWSLKDFDLTVGFPGEGPEREGPYGRTTHVLNETPVEIRVRNTFVEVSDAHQGTNGRLLRRAQSDGTSPPECVNLVGAVGQRLANTSLQAFAVDEQDADEEMRQSGASSQGGLRWYCPVPSCPKHGLVLSSGWTSFSCMRLHSNEHGLGRLDGQI